MTRKQEDRPKGAYWRNHVAVAKSKGKGGGRKAAAPKDPKPKDDGGE